jgi:hypothetical protein
MQWVTDQEVDQLRFQTSVPPLTKRIHDTFLWKLECKDCDLLVNLLARVKKMNFSVSKKDFVHLYFRQDIACISAAVTIQSCWRAYRVRKV